MTNIEIRRRIMEMVYERFKEHPYYRITPKEFREILNIEPKDLHYNIIYLEEKGYLELQKPLEGSIFIGARITAKGTDLVEDKYQFDIVFPMTRAEASTAVDVSKEFESLIGNVKTSDKINIDLKELIIEEIKEIQKELKNTEPSYSKVKSFLNKINEKDIKIGEQVLAVLKNPVITNILSKSAKEL